MRFEVVVELKAEVLDTEGRAIQSTLARLGHSDLKNVAVSKRFVLELEGGEDEAFQKAQNLAKEHLANPVSETFLVRKL
jgi:phosphoribosylformylglycinamidine synthase